MKLAVCTQTGLPAGLFCYGAVLLKYVQNAVWHCLIWKGFTEVQVTNAPPRCITSQMHLTCAKTGWHLSMQCSQTVGFRSAPELTLWFALKKLCLPFCLFVCSFVCLFVCPKAWRSSPVNIALISTSSVESFRDISYCTWLHYPGLCNVTLINAQFAHAVFHRVVITSLSLIKKNMLFLFFSFFPNTQSWVFCCPHVLPLTINSIKLRSYHLLLIIKFYTTAKSLNTLSVYFT